MGSRFPFPPLYTAPVVPYVKKSSKETAAQSATDFASKTQNSVNGVSPPSYVANERSDAPATTVWESDTETLSPAKAEQPPDRERKNGFRAQLKKLID